MGQQFGKVHRFSVEVRNSSLHCVCACEGGAAICQLEAVTLAETGNVGSVADMGSKLFGGLDLSGCGLDGEQVQKVSSMLEEWRHVFALRDTELGCTSATSHRIPLTDNTPFKLRHHRIPPALYEEVRQHLKEMQACGAIRPSHSPWASPIVLVRKRDGSLRFCIDFRKLNTRTPSDAYPIPRIEETLEALNGSVWFSSLDLKSGFWQVPVAEVWGAKCCKII